jgi:glycosyltransferase involved in cell wall biosynthesis
MRKKKQIIFFLEPFRAVYRWVTVLLIQNMLRNAPNKVGMAPVALKSNPNAILYVAASSLPYHVSGYTNRTHAVLKALDQGGMQVIALTRPGYPWDRSDRLLDEPSPDTLWDSVQYAHLPSPSHHRPLALYVRQASRQITQFALERQVGCIQAASNHVNALPALIAAKALGIPFFYEMRGLWELTRSSRVAGFEHSQGFQQGLELEGLVAGNADRLYVISEQLARFAMGKWGIEGNKIALLPNCVCPEDFPLPDAAAIEPNTIGYAGSILDYEGLDVLLHAMALLQAQGIKIGLRVIGDGETLVDLKDLAQQLGITGQVRFYGRLPPNEARAEIARCTLVCLPRKPFAVCELIPPIKLVEALAMAKPVIVPNLPVFWDELHAGMPPEDIDEPHGAVSVPGWFFKAGDASDLARAIASAFADTNGLALKSLLARSHASEHRNWQSYVADIGSSFGQGGFH